MSVATAAAVRRNAAALVMDPLEARRLFAAAPLVINGTAGHDFIELTQTATHYVVTLNGVATSHAFADVSNIDVKCGDGDDVIVATSLQLGFYADGGNGNDALIGGHGADTFLGAAGKDVLYGGPNNDRLNGAGGNDKVLGEAGADRCYGGDGNDYIDGGSSNDRIYLNNGLDTAFGSGGNDIFYAIDRQRDELFGGSGTDTATCDSGDLRASLEHVAVI
jgi:Ca2+-binding RTX toxin-like protein